MRDFTSVGERTSRVVGFACSHCMVVKWRNSDTQIPLRVGAGRLARCTEQARGGTSSIDLRRTEASLSLARQTISPHAINLIIQHASQAGCTQSERAQRCNARASVARYTLARKRSETAGVACSQAPTLMSIGIPAHSPDSDSATQE